MVAFIQQVFAILTTQPGSLAYNLVLAFSIVAALLATLIQWRSHPSQEADRVARRILFGLGLLLLLRLVLFISAGLAWQQMLDANLALPILERAVDILSLVVIIWLWAFPEPTLVADLLTAGLLLALIVLVGLVYFSGFGSNPDQALNASTLDGYSQILALAISALGVLLLLVLRPAWWSTGLVMILILGAGHLLQLLVPVQGNYPGAVRLAQMVAYPLLIALAFRLSALVALPAFQASGQYTGDTGTTGLTEADPVLQNLVMDWIQAPDPRQAGERLAADLAGRVQADLCLFLWPPDEADQVAARYGYDLVHRLAIPDLLMPAKKLPVLTQAFAQNRPVRLPGNSTAPDLHELIRQLDLKRTGALLSVPVRTPDDQAVVQVLMLSPFNGRSWTGEDQERLQAIASPLAHILQRNRQITVIQDELDQAQKSLISMHEQIVKAESDRDNLMDLVSILQQKPGNDLTDSSPLEGDLQTVDAVVGNGDEQDFDQATSNDEGTQHE